MTQRNFTDYLYGLQELVCIHDMRRMTKTKDAQLIYLVEFKDSDKYEWIDSDIMKRNYPRKLIEFYEKFIKWE